MTTKTDWEKELADLMEWTTASDESWCFSYAYDRGGPDTTPQEILAFIGSLLSHQRQEILDSLGTIKKLTLKDREGCNKSYDIGFFHGYNVAVDEFNAKLSALRREETLPVRPKK